MTNSISVSFQYTKEDILNSVIETLALEKGKCFLFLVIISLISIIAIVMFFIKFIVLGVLFLILTLAFMPISLLILYLNLSNVLRPLTDCVYTVENGKLITASNLGLTTFELKNVEKIVVTDSVILVYISKKEAFYIPIRAFSTKEKVENFIKQLEQGVSD